MWFNPPAHPTPLPPGHECYFLWTQCDHDGQVRIKMSALRNVTESELKWFIDLNRFNVPESKLCFLNPLPLTATRLGCVSNGNLLQCFSPFKKKSFIGLKENSLKEKPTLASLSANMPSLIWLFVCKVYLTWHLTIEFPVPSADLEKETELEAWKSPLHCMKDGENTLGRFVKSSKLTVRSLCDFLLYQIKPRCRLSKPNITLGCCWF